MRSTTVSRFILAAALAASPLLAGRLAPAPTGVTPTIEHGVRRPAAGTLVRVDIHHLADLTSFRLPVGTLSNVSEAALVPATAPPPPPAPPPQAPSTPAQVAAATVAAMPTWEVQQLRREPRPFRAGRDSRSGRRPDYAVGVRCPSM